MNNNKKSLRVTSAIYFVLISIPITVIIQFLLYQANMSGLLSVAVSLLLSVLLAYALGWSFGKVILDTTAPYKLKCFLLGILYCLCFVFIYDVFLVFLLDYKDFTINNQQPGISSYLVAYLYILIYSLITVASWLSILMGLATVYLRRRFIKQLKAFSAHKENEASI